MRMESVSIIGGAGLLLLGRCRKAWAFCRVPPERLSGRRRLSNRENRRDFEIPLELEWMPGKPPGFRIR